MRRSAPEMPHGFRVSARLILVCGLLGWAAGGLPLPAAQRSELGASVRAEDGDVGVNDPPVDADSDGFLSNADCDDSNPAVYPGAPQVCWDGVNNDCQHPAWPGLASTWEERILAPGYDLYLFSRFPVDFDGDGVWMSSRFRTAAENLLVLAREHSGATRICGRSTKSI